MSYGTISPSPSGSPSPSTTPSSTSSSPETRPTCLDPSTMNSQAESSHSTPSHSSADLPSRIPLAASKGGCWTCRLRRKKCDELREGDTCQTCKRLTIKCLGWGAKRPDWMRDKKAVDAYKAGIKEQLNRAGLIRGQPRSSLLNRGGSTRGAAMAAATRRPPHRVSEAAAPQQPSSLGLGLRTHSHEELPYFPPPMFNEPYAFPEMPGASNPVFDNVFGGYVQMNGHESLGIMPMGIPSLPSTGLTFDNLPDFSFTNEAFSDVPQFASTSQQTINIDQVLYEFNMARQMLFIFDAHNVISNVTYDLIKQDPSGPVSKAVCALGRLHHKRMLVSQGMESDTKPEQSPAMYYRDEALYALKSTKELQRGWKETDAIAAFFLILFSQLSGGVTDWDEPFTYLCEWLAQTGLPNTEEPWLCFQDFSPVSQLAIKGTLWIDIFSGITTGKAPKFFPLWRRLLGERGTYWDQNNVPFHRGLRMDTLIGCPDEALLMIAEVSMLAQWKATAQRDGTLSYRELIHKGTAIEQRLLQNLTDVRLFNDINHEPGNSDALFPSYEIRVVVANLFREAATLYLNTVLNNPNPGVLEIEKSVRNIIQLLRQSSPEVERGVILPLTLAGCMTNDSIQREFIRGRIQVQNESIGSLMQARLLMELMWQKRDVNVAHNVVSIPETVQEKNLRLLLL